MIWPKASRLTFQFHRRSPDSYVGKFKLSQDYPVTLLKISPDDLPWSKIDPHGAA